MTLSWKSSLQLGRSLEYQHLGNPASQHSGLNCEVAAHDIQHMSCNQQWQHVATQQYDLAQRSLHRCGMRNVAWFGQDSRLSFRAVFCDSRLSRTVLCIDTWASNMHAQVTYALAEWGW